MCEIISTGKSKSQPFQDCLTEICNLAAISQIEIKAQHLTSDENRISDVLSRWHLDKSREYKFKKLTEGFNLQKFKITDQLFTFINDW